MVEPADRPGGEAADANAGDTSANWGAAYHRTYFACPTVAPCTSPFFDSQTVPTEPLSYDLNDAVLPGSSDWHSYFYYGNVPDIFWQQNFPSFMTPGFSSWATSAPAGSYRGECPDGLSLNGISENGSHIAHAIHCGSTYRAPSPSCYTLAVGTTDNRKTLDGGHDWDPGFTKVECDVNEFIGGVSQTSTGVLNGVLCCPTAPLNRSGLGAVTFYNGNAGAPNEHDWDVGYYKGACSPTSFMSGISKVSTTAQGVVGAIHSIFCGG